MSAYIIFWALTLSTSPFIKRKITTYIFIFLVFFFIGLRYETGFDWPYYKDIYILLGDTFDVTYLFDYSLIYGQEPGFVIFFGTLSKYLPSYEYIQILINAVFLLSIIYLCKAFGVTRIAAVIAIAMSFLLWSVGFSTMRQSLAISMFNFGLVAYIRRKYIYFPIMMFLAVMFHYSSIVYIIGAVVAQRLGPNRSPAYIWSVFGLVTIAVSALFSTSLLLAGIISPLMQLKIEFYTAGGSQFSIGILDIAFALFCLGAAALASQRPTRIMASTPHSATLRNLIVVFAGIDAGVLLFPVFRDRVSYELFILISIYLLMPGLRYRWLYTIFFVVFGIAISVISFFPYPARLAFDPYQNLISSYILDIPSTGRWRSEIFMMENKSLRGRD